MAVTEGRSLSTCAVVCAHSDDRRGALRRALHSLSEQTVPLHELIVVVDHNPGLLSWVRELFPDAIAIGNQEAPGLAGTRNTGVRAASGDVVAFLDDDARAAADWVERLTSGYSEPRVLGVGGAVIPTFISGRPGWLPEEFDWVVGCTYRGLPETRSTVRNLIGTNMSFRREAIEQAGGFSLALGRVGDNCLGCEETELCIRLKHNVPDGVLLYDPTARVSHEVPRARTTLRYFVSRCHAEGHSKAEVVRRCGASRGLASERAYTRRTLPAAAGKGLAAPLQGDWMGLARTGAIAIGLVATATGFAAASAGAHGR